MEGEVMGVLVLVHLWAPIDIDSVVEVLAAASHPRGFPSVLESKIAAYYSQTPASHSVRLFGRQLSSTDSR
jgi:hypothetical protein